MAGEAEPIVMVMNMAFPVSSEAPADFFFKKCFLLFAGINFVVYLQSL